MMTVTLVDDVRGIHVKLDQVDWNTLIAALPVRGRERARRVMSSPVNRRVVRSCPTDDVTADNHWQRSPII